MVNVTGCRDVFEDVRVFCATVFIHGLSLGRGVMCRSGIRFRVCRRDSTEVYDTLTIDYGR